MSESTLSLARTDLQRAVGFYLGYGATPASYTADQQSTVNECIDSGLRQFYSPPPVPGERNSHQWSFLTPIQTLPLVAGQGDYDLPDDYAGLASSAYLSSDDEAWTEIQVISPARMLMLRQRPMDNITGPPQYIADQARNFDGTSPTRWTLMVYPSPDAAYLLKYPYRCNPLQLSASAAYPLGGAPHAETLRESCLAAAELLVNDERGIHYKSFIERLVASVNHDRLRSGAKSFGYNGDRERVHEHLLSSDQLVTVNGLIPGA